MVHSAHRLFSGRRTNAPISYPRRRESAILLGRCNIRLLSSLGTWDIVQWQHSVLRNYPITAHMRFVFEDLRPELRQYFFESNLSGAPFNREQRSLVYQRAKNTEDKLPFGTELDIYSQEYAWLNHSASPPPASITQRKFSPVTFTSASQDPRQCRRTGAAYGCGPALCSMTAHRRITGNTGQWRKPTVFALPASGHSPTQPGCAPGR